METQHQHADTHRTAEAESDRPPDPVRRERTGIWRKRIVGLLVLAAFTGLGLLLSQLARFGENERPVDIHAYRDGDRARSIHLALHTQSGEITGDGIVSLVFARTPVEVDFNIWTIQLSDGRHVPLPRTDDLILVDASGQVSRHPFRQHFQLLPILNKLPGMPFDRLQAEFERVEPTTAQFWQN